MYLRITHMHEIFTGDLHKSLCVFLSQIGKYTGIV